MKEEAVTTNNEELLEEKTTKTTPTRRTKKIRLMHTNNMNNDKQLLLMERNELTEHELHKTLIIYGIPIKERESRVHKGLLTMLRDTYAMTPVLIGRFTRLENFWRVIFSNPEDATRLANKKSFFEIDQRPIQVTFKRPLIYLDMTEAEKQKLHNSTTFNGLRKQRAITYNEDLQWRELSEKFPEKESPSEITENLTPKSKFPFLTRNFRVGQENTKRKPGRPRKELNLRSFVLEKKEPLVASVKSQSFPPITSTIPSVKSLLPFTSTSVTLPSTSVTFPSTSVTLPSVTSPSKSTSVKSELSPVKSTLSPVKSTFPSVKSQLYPVIYNRGDDNYTDAIQLVLAEISKILSVQKFVEGIFFLAGNQSEGICAWISSDIMYKRSPLLTLQFYESNFNWDIPSLVLQHLAVSPTADEGWVGDTSESSTEEIPSVQPSVPTAQPSVPIVQPSVPIVQPSVPTVQPSVPIVRPAVPIVQPSVPTVQPSVPTVQPSILPSSFVEKLVKTEWQFVPTLIPEVPTVPQKDPTVKPLTPTVLPSSVPSPAVQTSVPIVPPHAPAVPTSVPIVPPQVPAVPTSVPTLRPTNVQPSFPEIRELIEFADSMENNVSRREDKVGTVGEEESAMWEETLKEPEAPSYTFSPILPSTPSSKVITPPLSATSYQKIKNKFAKLEQQIRSEHEATLRRHIEQLHIEHEKLLQNSCTKLKRQFSEAFPLGDLETETEEEEEEEDEDEDEEDLEGVDDDHFFRPLVMNWELYESDESDD